MTLITLKDGSTVTVQETVQSVAERINIAYKAGDPSVVFKSRTGLAQGIMIDQIKSWSERR